LSSDSSKPDGEAVDLAGRHQRLVGRTALVSVLTLVSRVLGFVREILSAALFGDRSPIFDAFITAWRVPNLFRRFLGEGALSTSFQTALTRVDGEQGLASGARLFRDTLWLLTWLLVALCVATMACIWLLPDRMPVTGWAWLGSDPEPVRDLTVRVMPFVILACVSALIGGALQVRGHFASPAWAPAALNVVWIVTLLGIAAAFGWSEPGSSATSQARHTEMTQWLAWGVLVAGVVQLAVQFPALARLGFLERGAAPASRRVTAGQVLRRSLPLALGAAVYQINVMLDGLMAEGLLPDGGPTLHYYANRVQQFPMALIAIAATSAVFPALQAHGVRGDLSAVRKLHDATHRAICFVALPASVGLFVLSPLVVTSFFEHGSFGSEGVTRTAGALRYLTLAILPAGATGLVARTYYALGDFKTPVRISASMLVVNAGLNLVCIWVLGMDVDGLALATATTSWLGLVLLLPGLRSRLQLPKGEARFWRPVGKMVFSALAMGVTAFEVARVARPALGKAAALAIAIGVGIAAYQILATVLRVPEAVTFVDRLRRRSRGRP